MIEVVLPGDVDDPAAPSGGNVYDRRVCARLDVRETAIPGTWPRPDTQARAQLADALAAFPDGAVVLLDGLVACGVPEIVGPAAARLRLAVLVHLALADETGLEPSLAAELDRKEREVLRAASAVIATSPAAARQLESHHGLGKVHVVTPGVDPAPLARGTDGVSRLLCVASVTPRKGHDVLVEALAALADLPWRCVCVGPLRETAHTERVRELIARHGLGDRVELTGPLTGKPLDDAYAAADLFVLPSHAETYGMVVTEALARGIPVLASAVPDALGDGGVLVPPGALTSELRRWLTDGDHRDDLRAKARRRRAELSTWDESARELGEVLATLRA
ncbi:glycosyltransferase family 4 protein [Amycolatopsis sp. NPDC059657]|uniref:glycosyltransferase family 4 protein n=1 Tax=Amycolatopsis sp. NPDC059657 TaxID=3346899 RepID=UPI00367273C5